MTGVILINFGGPVPPKQGEGEPIELFLLDILRDVLPCPLKPFAKIFARLRLPCAKKMYEAIGGTSPVVSWTMKQAQALEYRLNGHVGEGLCPLPELRAATKGRPYKIHIGMKYGKPSIDNAIARAKSDGCEKIILLPLFPYRSKYTDLSLRLSAGFLAEGARATKRSDASDVILSEAKDPPRLVHWIDSLRPIERGCAHNDKPHPLYIRCMVDIIRSSLADWRDIPPPQVTLLFTAHAIPIHAARIDPYLKQINESVCEIMKSFTGCNYQIAFQSQSGPIRWTTPDVKTVINRLAHLSTYALKHLLIIPLGFACENLETLYELDQLYLPFAKSLGLNVKRTPALNDNPIFIDLLAELVLSNRSSTLYLSAKAVVAEGAPIEFN